MIAGISISLLSYQELKKRSYSIILSIKKTS